MIYAATKFSAIIERTKIEFKSKLGKKFMEEAGGNLNIFERKKLEKSLATDYNAID